VAGARRVRGFAAGFLAAGLRAGGLRAAGLRADGAASPSLAALAAAGLRAARAAALIDVTSIRVSSWRWPVRRLYPRLGLNLSTRSFGPRSWATTFASTLTLLSSVPSTRFSPST